MKKILVYFSLSSLVFLSILPVIMLLFGSISDATELQYNLQSLFDSQEKGFVSWNVIPQFIGTWGYIELLLDSPEFFVMFWNTLEIVFIILFLQLIISVTAAWAFAQFEFKGKKILFSLYVILMLMPFQVTMVSNYLVLDKIHLMNTKWAIILPAAVSTFTVFIIYRFFTAIPKEMIEAAAIDGAGDFKIFLLIGLPLGLPGIIAAMTLNFLEYWNMVEQPMVFLKDQSKWPLSLYLPTISMQNLSIAFAASVMTLFPALLVFLSGEEYLEQGILTAGLKE